MSWLWGSSTNPQYEELVEKACSPLNLPYPQSEDIALNLEITDMIRSKAVQPKAAMQSLKRRVTDRNGRVQMYAMSLIDTCIKNGGDHFLAEIASKEFVDEMSSMIRSPLTNAEVKQMALKHFQAWALAFESKRELSFLVDVYRELKSSGAVSFPPPPSQTSSHLLDTTTAPQWVDSDVCMRCRSAFTFTNRKHHCRNCGLVYDQACSSRTMPLPRFGIKEPVRVCESCFMKNGKVDAPAGPAPAVPGRTPRSRQDLDADLQRAIELSLAESQPSGRNFVGSEPPLVSKPGTVEDDDEELRLAIEASLREMEKERPSAPEGGEEPDFKPLPTYDLTGRETETILTFSNTMDQMAAYGERNLQRFPHAHVLAQQAYALSGKLQRNAEEKTTKQQMLMEMQDKLSQAVTLYGQILDGQQAYSAQKLQEMQQRQYQQQQNSYSNYSNYAQQPQYSYNPPQMNGHTSPYPSYAPPQTQAQSAKAGPSLYPLMPNFAPPESTQQQYYSSPQQQQHQPQYSYHAQGLPVSAPTWANGEQNNLERQRSNASYQPNRVDSYHSQPYHAAPQQSSAAPQAVSPIQTQSHPMPTGQPPVDGYRSPTMQPSAPPPVDMASHPASSPTSSIHTALPPQPQSQSYNSTSPIAQAPPPSQLPSSPPPQTQPQPQYPSPQKINPQPQPAAYAPSAPQQAHPANQQYTPQPQQSAPPAQPQAYPGNVYSVSSFPEAPSAVFPDAPSMEPNGGLEKQEKEEALLIEL